MNNFKSNLKKVNLVFSNLVFSHLSPNDLKLSTRRSHRGSSMIYNGSSPYSSMHSISSTRNNSGRNSYASSHRNSATSPRRMGSSLESVPSAENVLDDANKDGDKEDDTSTINSRTIPSDSIRKQLTDIIDVEYVDDESEEDEEEEAES